MSRLARLSAAFALLVCGAYALAGEAYVALVPWRVVEPGANVDEPLALYWIPASADELRRSAMLTSDELTLFSSQCVAMRVVRLSDADRVEAFGADAELPVAVLTNRAGEIVGRVDSAHGALSVAEVEDLVRDELERRAAELDAVLDRARKRAEADDIDGAVALYRAVWEERCVCPRQGKDARKALKKLGRR